MVPIVVAVSDQSHNKLKSWLYSHLHPYVPQVFQPEGREGEMPLSKMPLMPLMKHWKSFKTLPSKNGADPRVFWHLQSENLSDFIWYVLQMTKLKYSVLPVSFILFT